MNHEKEIIQKFKEMQTKSDLVALLNLVRPLVYPESKYTFSEKQINYYSAYKINNRKNQDIDTTLYDTLKKLGLKSYGGKYKTFEIKKKSGKTRVIHAPNRGLKAIQKCLNYILQTIYTPHPAATGFVPGLSIVDNALKHVGMHYVYNIDLKDFFPSIDQARVRGRFLVSPFNLGENEEKKKIASIMAILCCTTMKTERLNNETGQWEEKILNVLPQGAPTSPAITNIICEKMDIRLSGLAKRFGCKYSRYADDITFSSMHNVYHINGDFINELDRIIRDQNFQVNESKTRLQKQGYRQEVTGLIVNEKTNVNKRYIKQIRQWLYFWEKYGSEKASVLFKQQYFEDKGHSKKGEPSLENVLWGKLEYLKMVKGAKESTYIGLKTRYDALMGIGSEDINTLLDIWETEGIHKAIKLYSTKNLSIKLETQGFDELFV